MASTRPQRFFVGAFLLGPLAPVLLLAAMFGSPRWLLGCASCFGYRDLVDQAFRGCPQTGQLLGEPYDYDWVGCAPGNMRSGGNDTHRYGSDGYAYQTVPVSGSRAHGSYRYAVEKQGNTWRPVSATLRVGDQTVDLLACGSGAPVMSAAGVVQLPAEKIELAPPAAPPLNTAIVERLVHAHAPELRRCFEAAPPAAGAIRLGLTLEGSGQVSGVQIDGTPGRAALDACVTGIAGAWRFPPFEGGPVTLQVPIVVGAAAR